MSNTVAMDLSVTSTLSCFTEDEIKDAQKDARLIVSKLRKIGDDMFEAVRLMYDFEQSGKYKAIGFETVKDWITSEGFAPSTFMKYLEIYTKFTIKLGIDPAKYRYLDIGKIVTLKALASAGASKEEILDSIAEAEDLTSSDLIISTDDKVRRLDDGKSVERKPDEVKNVKDDLEPGAYKIVKVTSKDVGADPRYNMKKMIRIKRLATKWFYNTETKEFTVVIK